MTTHLQRIAAVEETFEFQAGMLHAAPELATLRSALESVQAERNREQAAHELTVGRLNRQVERLRDALAERDALIDAQRARIAELSGEGVRA